MSTKTTLKMRFTYKSYSPYRAAHALVGRAFASLLLEQASPAIALLLESTTRTLIPRDFVLILQGSRPPVFVTGGVGGVHRGGERSLDVSADLAELGRAGTPVVSAGVKSILDIGRTLEFLVRIKYRVNHQVRRNLFSTWNWDLPPKRLQ